METRKRKALADITSTENLIPISDLRKLVASTVNSNSISKPSIPILRSSFSSTNYKIYSDEENRYEVGSGASIGSSNISSTRNSRTVQFRTPFISPGYVGSKDASYYRRQNVEKSNNKVDPDVVIISPTAAEKRRDKGKSIAVPLCTPHPKKRRDDENVISNPFRLLEKSKLKDKVNLSLRAYPTQKGKEYGKGIINPPSCCHQQMEKGKAIVNSSSLSEGKMEEETGKGIGNYSSSSLEKTIEKKKGILKHSDSSAGKSRGKEILSSSRIVIEGNKEKGKALRTFAASHEKASEKGKAILHPDRVEIMKQVIGAANCQPTRNKSVKSENCAGTSSCPPMLRTKIMNCDLDGAGSTESSTPWTDPRPAARKKRFPGVKDWSELPRMYVQQQIAYFAEVDAFELAVEEVSEGELD